MISFCKKRVKDNPIPMGLCDSCMSVNGSVRECATERVTERVAPPQSRAASSTDNVCRYHCVALFSPSLVCDDDCNYWYRRGLHKNVQPPNCRCSDRPCQDCVVQFFEFCVLSGQTRSACLCPAISGPRRQICQLQLHWQLAAYFHFDAWRSVSRADFWTTPSSHPLCFAVHITCVYVRRACMQVGGLCVCVCGGVLFPISDCLFLFRVSGLLLDVRRRGCTVCEPPVCHVCHAHAGLWVCLLLLSLFLSNFRLVRV